MSEASVFDAVRAGAGAPDRTAIVGERLWTFRALLTAAERFAGRLAERGAGGPVAARLKDPVSAAVVTLGCDLARVPVIHQDPSSPEALPVPLVHDGPRSAGDREAVALEDRTVWVGPTPETGADAGLAADLPGNCQIFLTSGSEGAPMGVVRSAEALLADARRVAGFLGYRYDVPLVAAVPLFHVYGFNYALLAPLLSGTAVRHCPSRSVPSRLARAVEAHRAGQLIALPVHFGLLAADEAVRPASLASLAWAVTAGAPLRAGVAAQIGSRFDFTLYNCYGSSEAGAVTLAPVRNDQGEGGAYIGSPLPGVHACLAPVPGTYGTDDAAGELLLLSGSLALGRLGPAGLVPLDRHEGWYRTGDLAARTAPGEAIKLLGRLGSLINVAGEKVNPWDVERVLLAHPAVREAQVLAAADTVRGQVPFARVVLTHTEGTASAADLAAWCRSRLAPHQMPRRVEVVASLPRSSTGKVVQGPAPEVHS